MRTKVLVPIGQGCKAVPLHNLFGKKTGSYMCKEHLGLYINICLNCGSKFHTSRPHAKTCSNLCRLQLHRSKGDILFQTIMQFADGVK